MVRRIKRPRVQSPSGLPHSRWHQYRPVRHKPSHRGAAPWRLARRKAFPVRRRQAFRDAFCRVRDGFGLAPGGDAVIGSDAKNIALACSSKRPFNCANAVNAIGGNKGERHGRGNGLFDHANRQGRLGCEGRFLRNMRSPHAGRIVCPRLRQIKRPVDEGMAVRRNITGKYADLAVRDLACRTGILPRNAA